MIAFSLIWFISAHVYHPCCFCLFQVVIMLASLVVIFFVTWTPRSVYILYNAVNVNGATMKDRILAVGIQAVTMVNTMINPIIYAITSL